MRIRTRTIVNNPSHVFTGSGSAPWSWAQCSGVVSTGIGFLSSATTPVDYDVELMFDEIGRLSNNPVTHRKKKVRINTVTASDFKHGGATSGIVTYAGFGGIDVSNHAYCVDQFAAFNQNADMTFAPTDPGCWTIVKPGVDQNASLKEDCFEKARQLKADVLLDIVEANQMLPSINSMVSCLPEMARNWKSIRKVLATSSSAYLAWKFGIKPVISDIVAIQKALPKLQGDLDRHAKGETQRFSSVAKCPASFAGTFTTPAWYSISATGEVIRDPVVRYVLRVKPKVSPYLSDFLKKADGLASRFSTTPANLAWELVPWSFVLDWFVDVRGALRAIDGMLGWEPYHIVSFSKSLTYGLKSVVHYHVVNTCDGSIPYSTEAGTVEFSHYERNPVSREPTWPTWKPRFGKNQYGVTAALISQKIANILR
jgi:hypothetical protein